MPWAPTDEGANYLLGLFADTQVYQTIGGSAATADGDPVAEWKDQSGNGNDFTQPDSNARRATLKTSGGPSGLGGKMLRGDGTNTVLYHATHIGAGESAWTIGIICTRDGSSNKYIESDGTGTRALISGFAGTHDIEYYGASPRFTVKASPGTGLHSIAWGGDSGGMASRYDGAAGGSSGTAPGTLYVSALFSSGAPAPNDVFDGDIACVLVFNRYDATLLANVEAYLAGLISGGAATTRGIPLGTRGTAFNGGRPLTGILR